MTPPARILELNQVEYSYSRRAARKRGQSEPRNDDGRNLMGNNSAMTIVRIRLVFFLVISVMVHALLLLQIQFGLHGDSGGKEIILGARLLPILKFDVPVGEPTEARQSGDMYSHTGESTSIAVSPTPVVESPPPDNSLSLPLFSMEDYLPASELTSPPSPVGSVDPTPPGFLLDGIVGEAVLLLLISSDGSVDEVLTVSSTLPEFFVAYAKEVFSSTRFTPGVVNNTAVRSRVRIALSPTLSHVAPETGNPLSAKNRRR